MNTVLATLWEEKHEVAIDSHALWNRCEPFAAEAPDGVCLLTAGVDVQADRLEMEVVGWGRDEESWSIGYHVIPGDILRSEVWARARRDPAVAVRARERPDAADRGGVHRFGLQGRHGAAVHQGPLQPARLRDQGPVGRRHDLAAQTEPEEPDAVLHDRRQRREGCGLRPREGERAGARATATSRSAATSSTSSS